LKEKMLLFNKPQVNEKELMIQQRKKASFTSKCAKFEGVKEPILTKKESLTKLKAKIFENSEPTEQVNLEEEKLRKESFQKAKEAFIDVEECSDAIDGSLTITDECPENEDCSEDADEEEKRRKSEFEAKQKLFNGENNS